MRCRLLARSFRVFGLAVGSRTLRSRVMLLWSQLLVQSAWPAEVSSLLVGPSHFAVGRFLGCVVFLQQTHWSQSCFQAGPLLEFRSPLEPSPTKPCRPAVTDQPLSWTLLPFSTSRLGDPLATGFPRPATFRLQGLVTLLTVYSLRARAGLVSCRRRSWDSPFGAFPSRKVSGALPPESTHLPFPLPAHPPPKRRAGPEGRGFWALTLPRVPRDRHGFSVTTAGGSLGFRPSRAYLRGP
jgi:hypothetical protein